MCQFIGTYYVGGMLNHALFFPLYPYPMEREGQKFWMPFGQVISNYHRSISDIIIQPIVLGSGFKTGNFFLAMANSLRIFTCLTAVFLTHHEMAPFCLSGLGKYLQRPPIRLLFNSKKISPLND